MPSASNLRDVQVIGPKGKPFGTVNFVLFHPEENRAVGVEIRPRAYGYVVERKPQYYALDAFELHEDHLELVNLKAASGSAAEKRLGLSWDDTVVWSYQEVKTDSGVMMGQIADVVFSKSGAVRRITVSNGATADMAIGRHTVEADHIIGFDGTTIRVQAAADDLPTSGGVAAQAGKSAAVAKHVAKRAGDGALKATVSAARVASKSKTAKRARKGWREFKDAFKDGMAGDD